MRVEDSFTLEFIDFFDCEVLLWGAGVACFIPFLCEFILMNEKGGVELCDFDQFAALAHRVHSLWKLYFTINFLFIILLTKASFLED